MRKDDKSTDLEIAKARIRSICAEFNVTIETDDWHHCWLRDRDTDETTSI